MNKCVIKGSLDKELNGLRVFFNILEEDVERSCVDCEEQGYGVHRQFEIVKVKRGRVTLRTNLELLMRVEAHIRKLFRHGEVLCFNCFETYVEDGTPGFDPAN